MSIYDEDIDGQAFTFSNDDSSLQNVASAIFSQSSAYEVGTTETLTQYYPDTYSNANSASVTDNSYFVATANTPIVITGYDGADGNIAASQTITFGVLSGVGATYETGSSQISEIIAADDSESTIVNDNPDGGLLAFTGNGGNALVGRGLLNVFQTSDGGSDVIIFDGGETDLQSNSLTSGGDDLVSIYGSPIGQQNNMIQAIGAGSDQIGLAGNADLTFVNNSSSISAIAMGEDSNLILAGGGTTVILAPEEGGSLTFVASGATGGETIVGNFTDNIAINLAGYAGYEANVVNGSTVLTLSDQSNIVFSGVSDPSAVLSRLSA